ncbi:MAG: DUF4234 domain-containing protein [Candidatus Obscuribacterales bacterium]|nr:DUF4234 domain-containing protein [Candidatus Obscuribacterales bacterium]
MSLEIEQESTVVEPALSRQQPLWHVVVLSILTCGAYPIYWFFKNWRDLKAEAINERQNNPSLEPFFDISPLLRTMGLFVPFLNIYFAVAQVKSIAELNPSEKSYSKQHPLIASGLVMGLLIGILFLQRLPGILYMLCFAAGVPLAFVQSWLNNYWRSVESPELIVRQTFTGKELIAVILGGLLIGLNLAGNMIGVTVK